MPRYRVRYKYITKGIVWLDAKNKKEAEENWQSEDLDNETVEKWFKPKIDRAIIQ